MRGAEGFFEARVGALHEEECFWIFGLGFETEGEIEGAQEDVGVFCTKDFFAEVEDGAVLALGFGVAFLFLEDCGEIVAAGEGLGVMGTEKFFAKGEHGTMFLFGFGVAAEIVEGGGEVVAAVEGV